MNKTITQKSIHQLAWYVWGVSALFYLYEYFLQVSPNVMTQELMQAFNIDGTHLGYLGGVYFISYAAMQIPVGFLLDRVGPKKALIFATLICMIGCILFGLTHSFGQALLARFFLGFGSAFAVVSTLKIVASWFPLNRFAILTGLTVTMGTLGAVIGQAPLALLVEKIQWRPTMVVLGILSGLLMILIAYVVKDHPEHLTQQTDEHPTERAKNPLIQGLLNIIKNRQCWVVGVYGGLMYVPTVVLGSLWGASYISIAYGIERSVAAGYISMLFFGWIIGSPLFGLFSDKLSLRKPPMYIAAIATFISLVFILYVQMPLFFIAVAFFSLGFFSSGFLPSFSIILEINHPRENATALGFMNTLNMIGPILLQPLVGFVLDTQWNGIMMDGARLYSIGNYRIALAILPICVLASLVFLPFIRETYCQRTSKPV